MSQKCSRELFKTKVMAVGGSPTPSPGGALALPPAPQNSVSTPRATSTTAVISASPGCPSPCPHPRHRTDRLHDKSDTTRTPEEHPHLRAPQTQVSSTHLCGVLRVRSLWQLVGGKTKQVSYGTRVPWATERSRDQHSGTGHRRHGPRRGDLAVPPVKRASAVGGGGAHFLC